MCFTCLVMSVLTTPIVTAEIGTTKKLGTNLFATGNTGILWLTTNYFSSPKLGPRLLPHLPQRGAKRREETTWTFSLWLNFYNYLTQWPTDQPTDQPASSTYYQVISRFSFIVPRSLMSTATTWGRAANRSFVSQVTLPTRMWVASPLTSVTCKRQEQGI